MDRRTCAPWAGVAAMVMAVVWATAVMARTDTGLQGIVGGGLSTVQQTGASASTPPPGEPRSNQAQDKSAAQKKTPPAAAPAAQLVGDDTCLTCHEDQKKGYANTVHGRPDHPRSPAARQGCETCHGPGSAHVDDPEAKGFIRAFAQDTPRDANAACLTCHTRGAHALWEGSAHDSRNLSCATCHSVHAFKSEKAQLKSVREMDTCATCHRDKAAKVDRSGHMPLREGKMECSTCHNPHGATNVRALRKGDSVGDLCTSCHADKRGPYLWEHAPTRDGCTTCHDPHGSSNERMLVTKTPIMCQRCHVMTRHPSTIYDSALIGSGATPSVRIFARSCVTCHSTIHGSNHPSGQRFIR